MPSVISYIRKASTGIPSELYFPILPKMLTSVGGDTASVPIQSHDIKWRGLAKMRQTSMWEGTQPLCPSSHMTSNGEVWLR